MRQRLTRFSVAIEVHGRRRVAWLRNTGRLLEFLAGGAPGLCLPRTRNGRTQYLLVGAPVAEGAAALFDPPLQMTALQRAAAQNRLPWLHPSRLGRGEPRVGSSRFDFALAGPLGAQGFLEVKSAVHCTGYYAEYPDCPSVRGQRHLTELGRLARRLRCVVVFIAAHPTVHAFRPDAQADPGLARRLVWAVRRGVEVYAVKLRLDPHAHRVLLIDPCLPAHLPVVDG